MSFRPVPRLSTALQRLGMPSAVAAAILSAARAEHWTARAIIRCAILQRHTPLAVSRHAPRDPPPTAAASGGSLRSPLPRKK